MERRRVAAMATTEPRRHVLRIAGPGKAERNGWMRRTTVVVVQAADEEVGPLGNVAGACDAAGVGAKIVCVAEGRVVRDAGEDDEPDKELRDAEEYEADGA